MFCFSFIPLLAQTLHTYFVAFFSLLLRCSLFFALFHSAGLVIAAAAAADAVGDGGGGNVAATAAFLYCCFGAFFIFSHRLIFLCIFITRSFAIFLHYIRLVHIRTHAENIYDLHA